MATFDSVVGAGPGWTTVRTSDGRTVTLSGSRNWRNNNPGNLEYGPFARGSGAIGTDGRFAVFSDYNTGRTAKEGLLFANPRYSDLSIADAISRYAPPVENNTTGYVNSITRALGVPADTPLSSLNTDQRNVMMDAMERVEGFRTGQARGVLGDPLDPATMQISPEYGYVPDSVPTPSPRPGLDQQSSAFGIMDAINPASTMPVERGPLAPAMPTVDQSASFGFGPEAAMSAQADVPAFDQGRFGPMASVPETFDVGRFGPMTGMNYDAMAAANMPSPAPVPQSPSIADFSPFSTAQAATMPAPAMPSMGALADQYAQYGMGQQALLADPGYQQKLSATNLATDVAQINPNLQQPIQAASAAPAMPGYTDPMVTTQAATAPAVQGPAGQAQVATPAPSMPSMLSTPEAQQVAGINAAGGTFGSPDQNYAVQMERQMNNRRMMSGLAGGLLGGLTLGPLGAIAGGMLGRSWGNRSFFPDAPSPVQGTGSRGSDPRGSSAYRDSGQFRDAVDSGSAGLW